MTAIALSSRKGARRVAVIPPTRLVAFNRGEMESRTLVEGMSTDFARLLRTTVPQLPKALTDQMHAAREAGTLQRMTLAGRLLLMHMGPTGYLALARHRSDTVRSWAAFLLAASPDFSLGEQLRLIRTLANDHSAGVRECAWLALRQTIGANVELAIDLLEAWTVSTSPFLRRFATEATRPHGAWHAKIDLLMDHPELGLPLLEPLRADPHGYVQDSVANWLQDVAQTQPAWVAALCRRWQRESRSLATERICERALQGVN